MGWGGAGRGVLQEKARSNRILVQGQRHTWVSPLACFLSLTHENSFFSFSKEGNDLGVIHRSDKAPCL